MSRFSKICAMLIMVVVTFEMLLSFFVPLYKGISYNDWSGLILWIFIPGLIIVLRIFHFALDEND